MTVVRTRLVSPVLKDNAKVLPTLNRVKYLDSRGYCDSSERLRERSIRPTRKREANRLGRTLTNCTKYIAGNQQKGSKN